MGDITDYPLCAAFKCYVDGKQVATIISRSSGETAATIRETAISWFGLPDSVEIEKIENNF